MTITSLDMLAAELRPHHNEMCLLYDDQVVRLLGVGRDDDDLYYIVQQRDRHSRTWSDADVTWCSAVGRITPLKPLVGDAQHARMESLFTLNKLPPNDSFLVEDRSFWDEKISTQARYVSKCGRLILSFDAENPDARFALHRRYLDAPGTPDAFILRGEYVALERVAIGIMTEMRDWSKEQALAARQADRQTA
ncbi:hypothetical protein ACOI1H_13455 [Loktanella sp. DJP18]|uniref:hypothetical protein n=1 Tax=Loktanella sp. DJP18 TaxID=3409788 RepID=UPI003BB5FEDC